MCFGSSTPAPSTPAPAPSTPKSVEQQILDQEAARQAAIKAGNTSIDSAFSQFNDPFYNGFKKSYTDYYNPQIDKQYTDAQGTTEAGLARQGIDRSSIAATQFGRLFGQYADARSQIGDDAASAANDLRTKVNNEKNNLYTLNSTSADPAQANTQALASSTALVTPPAYSPLGSVFASFLQPFTNYANAYSNNAGTPYQSPYATPTTSGKP